jgi:hypothetical protein
MRAGSKDEPAECPAAKPSLLPSLHVRYATPAPCAIAAGGRRDDRPDGRRKQTGCEARPRERHGDRRLRPALQSSLHVATATSTGDTCTLSLGILFSLITVKKLHKTSRCRLACCKLISLTVVNHWPADGAGGREPRQLHTMHGSGRLLAGDTNESSRSAPAERGWLGSRLNGLAFVRPDWSDCGGGARLPASRANDASIRVGFMAHLDLDCDGQHSGRSHRTSLAAAQATGFTGGDRRKTAPRQTLAPAQ